MPPLLFRTDRRLSHSSKPHVGSSSQEAGWSAPYWTQTHHFRPGEIGLLGDKLQSCDIGITQQCVPNVTCICVAISHHRGAVTDK